MLGVKRGAFWSWVTGWVGSHCLHACLQSCLDCFRHTHCMSAAALSAFLPGPSQPVTCMAPAALPGLLQAAQMHVCGKCTMLDCVLQINLLGQLAFVAGNEYTVVQVFVTMILLGTGTATGGGYLMSYGEVRPTRLQLNSSRCTDCAGCSQAAPCLQQYLLLVCLLVSHAALNSFPMAVVARIAQVAAVWLLLGEPFALWHVAECCNTSHHPDCALSYLMGPWRTWSWSKTGASFWV